MAKARKAATRKKTVKSSSKRSSAARRPGKTGESRRKAVRAKAAPPARKQTAARKTSRKRASPARARTPTTSTLKAAAEAVGLAVTGTVATMVAHTPWGGGDAIELLETDHRRLEDLLAKGEETTTRGVKTRTELLDTITRELDAHELIEEKLFYPALKGHPEAKDIVLEGYQEHHVADLIVKELHALARSDERWGAKFKVLKENIEHHIQEEEGEMFRTARAVMTREELQDLGERMQKMKSEALGR
jgi:hypothetical protein